MRMRKWIAVAAALLLALAGCGTAEGGGIIASSYSEKQTIPAVSGGEKETVDLSSKDGDTNVEKQTEPAVSYEETEKASYGYDTEIKHIVLSDEVIWVMTER